MNTANINNILGTTTISQVLVSSGSSWTNLDSSLTIDKNLIEYIDLLYQIMGVDITYDRWKNMSSGEKLQLVRDIKLKKIIEE
jgi:hypothetical protein